MQITKCPDCEGEFEKGVIMDHVYGGIAVQRYARSDVPDTGFQLKLSQAENPFYDVRKVMTYRCTKCNRLFSYALPTVTVKDVNANIKQAWLIIGSIILAVLIISVIIGITSS